MVVRAATAADVPGVLPLVRAICDLHASRDPERFAVVPDVIERYAAWLPERAADARSVFLVAEWEAIGSGASGGGGAGRIAGYLVGTVEPEVPIFWVPECGWVHDVFVEPWARGRGLGRALVRGAVERFGAMGVKQMRLHTAMFNEEARGVFAAEGFRPCVVEMLRGL